MRNDLGCICGCGRFAVTRGLHGSCYARVRERMKREGISDEGAVSLGWLLPSALKQKRWAHERIISSQTHRLEAEDFRL